MSDLSLQNTQQVLDPRRRFRALDAIVLALVILALWQAIGSEVSRLMRIRYGPVSLPRDLAAGSWQLLSPQVYAELTVAGSKATTMGAADKPAPPPDEPAVWQAARERRRTTPSRGSGRRPPARDKP